jgi:hypothetical protein
VLFYGVEQEKTRGTANANFSYPVNEIDGKGIIFLFS